MSGAGTSCPISIVVVRVRYLVALLATLIAATGFLGCGAGNGNDSSTVVAAIGDGRDVITRGMLSHWMLIAAFRDAEESGYSGTVQRVVMPDPPLYHACIGSLAPGRGASKQGREGLKGACTREYDALKTQALQGLITAEWFFAEGEARGLRVSAADVRRRTENIRRHDFPNRSAYERYLRRGGETEADRLFRSRIKLFSAKIQQQAEGRGAAGERQRAMLAFFADFPREWTAKTDCREGFVVPNCRQYRGSVGPSIELL